ncbi:hypothetical protein M446_1143 [Methylobacterium sp. 4-46]|uniref:L,D-transpeptidase family protein n=1 Tax=unclassified Methylobacterium TaxID=2615210 RepID=UPI000152DB5F|nr:MULTISPECIES: L,D-transpeptidase family protein [Methylobacterium]ACA15670.1 hypothetical protein M446_1143 [Methylobacterium sp. 4-46]WFT81382.1 hypothetical protein QA634_05685 [Methylobacterium nodulans]
MRRLEGRSMYIVRLMNVMAASGGVDPFVQRCTDAHLASIWIRMGYGRRIDPNLRHPDFSQLHKKLTGAGIQIWGWHVPRCPNVEIAQQEAELVVGWARDFTLAGVLLDAEQGDRFFQGGGDEAAAYVRQVETGLSALGAGLALSSHDAPRFFPNFPFPRFLSQVSDNCPQVYYTKEVSGRLNRSIQQYKALELSRAFADRYKPVGNITIRGDVAHESTAACLERAAAFVDLVTEQGFKAYGFWCADEAPDEIWQFLKGKDVFPAAIRPAAAAPLAAAAPPAAAAPSISEGELDSFADDVRTLQALAEDDQREFYDTVLASQIEEFALRARDAADDATLMRWLQIQSLTAHFVTEGVADVTFDLWRRSDDHLNSIVATLPPEARSRIRFLFQEFADTGEASPPGVLSAPLGPRAFEAPDLGEDGVLAAFTGTGTFTSARGFPVVSGTLAVLDPDRGQVVTFTANSGGGARGSRATYGPTPPGIYRVSNHRPNRTTAGMVLEGVGFSFDLDPTAGTPVYGRSLFRIHPDGGAPQTNGCIGVREHAGRLRDVENLLNANLRANGGRFKLTVKHQL